MSQDNKKDTAQKPKLNDAQKAALAEKGAVKEKQVQDKTQVNK